MQPLSLQPTWAQQAMIKSRDSTYKSKAGCLQEANMLLSSRMPQPLNHRDGQQEIQGCIQLFLLRWLFFFFLVSMVAAQSPKILSSEKTWQQECVQCSAKSTSGQLINATAFTLIIRQVHLHVHKSRGHVLKRSISAILSPWPKACFNWLFQQSLMS